MKKANSVRLINVAAAVFAGGFITDADANGFAVREQSAAGLGVAFAGEGTPGMGPSALYWNPAAVTQSTGLVAEADFTYLASSSRLAAQTGTTPSLLALGAEDSIGKPGYIPTLFLAYKFNSDWYAGLAIDVPFGLSTNADPWAGQQLAMHAAVQTGEFTPIIGWRIDDFISAGAGARIVYFKGTFSRALSGTPGFPPLPAEFSADDVGFGFNVGATLTPIPDIEIAVGYRSRVTLHLTGHNQFPTSAILALSPLAPFNGTRNGVVGDLTLPDQFNVGARYHLTDTLSLLSTAEWIGWSPLQSFSLTYTDGPAPNMTAATLNFNYRDGWFFSVGSEYYLRPQTALRIGVGYQISPITDQFRQTSLPETTSWQLSAGVVQELTDHLSLDFGYSFITYPDATIAVVPGHPDFATTLRGNSLIARATAHAHILSTSIRYEM